MRFLRPPRLRTVIRTHDLASMKRDIQPIARLAVSARTLQQFAVFDLQLIPSRVGLGRWQTLGKPGVVRNAAS